MASVIALPMGKLVKIFAVGITLVLLAAPTVVVVFLPLPVLFRLLLPLLMPYPVLPFPLALRGAQPLVVGPPLAVLPPVVVRPLAVLLAR